MNENYDFIQRLVLAFFKGSYIDITPEDTKILTWKNQEIFLNKTVYSPLLKNYPINQNFGRLFFKKLIHALERDQEVHDDIYKYICSTMENNNNNGFNYNHYIINNNLSDIIIIKESKNMVINGTTGLRTWEAALMLSDWSLSNKQLFSNKNILELGCGVGFTGITIAKYCEVKSLFMSDCHGDVLKTVDENIQINFPGAFSEQIDSGMKMYKSDDKIIGSLMLDWNESDEMSPYLVPDFIIGADIVYDPSILQPLLNVLDMFHKKNNKISIYIASVIRNKDTFNGFLNVIKSSGFQHEKINLKNNGFIEWNEDIDKSILKITKKRS